MGQAKRRGTYDERKKNAKFICIICRESKEALQRSDEHVIPDSLNGYYHIFNVCKVCNSNMGGTVDAALINHKFTELYRFNEGIKGKSGKIPNPFKEVNSLIGDKDVKVKTELSQAGELVYKTVPFVKYENNEDGSIKEFTIIVDSQDQNKLGNIHQSILNRHNLKENEFSKKTITETTQNNSVLAGNWEVDIQKFKLGLLKIAYEFAVDSISDYFKDPLAIKISEILKNADYNRLTELKIGSGFDSNLFDSIDNIFDLKKRRHILILFPINQSLCCFIKIDNLFQIGVILSNKIYMPFEQSIIGINDLEKRIFTKNTFVDLMNKSSGKIYTRLGFWAATELEINSKDYEPNRSEFKYEVKANGKPVIYQKNGKILPKSLSSLFIKENSSVFFENNEYIQEFVIKDDLDVFVKSIKSGKLYKVVSFQKLTEFSKI